MQDIDKAYLHDRQTWRDDSIKLKLDRLKNKTGEKSKDGMCRGLQRIKRVYNTKHGTLERPNGSRQNTCADIVQLMQPRACWITPAQEPTCGCQTTVEAHRASQQR